MGVSTPGTSETAPAHPIPTAGPVRDGVSTGPDALLTYSTSKRSNSITNIPRPLVFDARSVA